MLILSDGICFSLKANVRAQAMFQEKPADLVDPYAVFEFAGTKIDSMIQHGTFDPTWNQKLVIKSHFPSMAENFVIRVMDRWVGHILYYTPTTFKTRLDSQLCEPL